MPLTLDDAQVAKLRAFEAEAARNKEIAEFTNAILNDPALSNEAKALIKKKWPDLQIPDYDMRQYIDSQLKARDDERVKLEKEKTDNEAKERFASQRRSVQEQYQFTDDAMTRMEAEMEKRKVYDYEAMAPFFASKEPKPIENTTGGHFWNHHKQDTFKQIVSDPEDYAFNEIARAVQADDQRRRGMM